MPEDGHVPTASGSGSGAEPRAADLFDPVAFAARLREARVRRARALAERGNAASRAVAPAHRRVRLPATATFLVGLLLGGAVVGGVLTVPGLVATVSGVSPGPVVAETTADPLYPPSDNARPTVPALLSAVQNLSLPPALALPIAAVPSLATPPAPQHFATLRPLPRPEGFAPSPSPTMSARQSPRRAVAPASSIDVVVPRLIGDVAHALDAGAAALFMSSDRRIGRAAARLEREIRAGGAITIGPVHFRPAAKPRGKSKAARKR